LAEQKLAPIQIVGALIGLGCSLLLAQLLAGLLGLRCQLAMVKPNFAHDPAIKSAVQRRPHNAIACQVSWAVSWALIQLTGLSETLCTCVHCQR
jgi:uncharacterized membrane protein SpoIIM required for sporulation